jgi:hypothetical protein
VQLFYLSRVMGTSVAMIGATYGHLVSDSDDYLRRLLVDSYDLGMQSVSAEESRLEVDSPVWCGVG